MNDNNSEEFQASFVLELCKPLPAAVEVVQRIYEVVGKTGKKRSRLLVKRVKSREEHVKSLKSRLLKSITDFFF